MLSVFATLFCSDCGSSTPILGKRTLVAGVQAKLVELVAAGEELFRRMSCVLQNRTRERLKEDS